MLALNIRETLNDAWDRAVDQLISVGIAFLYILVVILLARIAVKFARRFVWNRITSTNIDAHTATLINNGISVCIYFAAATLLLALGGASWSTLLTAISISTLAVVLGLQDLLKSLLGGAFVIFDQPYSIGERIEIDGKEGEVVEVKLRTTVLRTPEGRRMTLPNSLVLVSPLENWDREVTSSTIVSVAGVVGIAEEVKAQIETALAVEPTIDATVSVSSQAPRSVRVAVTKWTGLLRKSNQSEVAQETPLSVRLFLASSIDSSHLEHDLIQRITDLYPSSKCTVRRSSESG